MESDEKLYQSFCIEYEKIAKLLNMRQQNVSSKYDDKATKAKDELKKYGKEITGEVKKGDLFSGLVNVGVGEGFGALLSAGKLFSNTVVSGIKQGSVKLTISETKAMWDNYLKMSNNNKYSIHIPAAVSLLKKIKYYLPNEYHDYI
jgi:hypothetical protein